MGAIVSGAVLLVATLLVQLLADGLSTGTRTAIIAVSTIAGAGLAGWSAQVVLAPTLARLISDRSDD
ncbi:hypothetical protein ACLQ3B_04415 [Micromonospora sp. DT53]|uniref:hypothetical protein n=1 Tax=Micromonospora sp. DT53 TaxID=3393444 RepID=UPI003CF7EBA7